MQKRNELEYILKDSAQNDVSVMEYLKSKIQTLENENQLLKERLDEAGISYSDIVSDTDNALQEFCDLDQGARIKRFEVTDRKKMVFDAGIAS